MTGRDGAYARGDVVDDDSEHLLKNVRDELDYCTSEDNDRGWRWSCTRTAGHDGQHEAAGLGIICAVWS